MGCCCPKEEEPQDSIDRLVSTNKIVLFARPNTCLSSVDAKYILDELGVDFVMVHLDQCPDGDDIARRLVEKTGFETIPQAFINGEFIGGAQDLAELRTLGVLAEITGGSMPNPYRFTRKPPACCNMIW